jgi:hypothetical protein
MSMPKSQEPYDAINDARAAITVRAGEIAAEMQAKHPDHLIQVRTLPSGHIDVWLMADNEENRNFALPVPRPLKTGK